MLYHEAYLRDIGSPLWEARLLRLLANELAQELTVVGIVPKVRSQIQLSKWENKKRV